MRPGGILEKSRSLMPSFAISLRRSSAWHRARALIVVGERRRPVQVRSSAPLGNQEHRIESGALLRGWQSTQETPQALHSPVSHGRPIGLQTRADSHPLGAWQSPNDQPITALLEQADQWPDHALARVSILARFSGPSRGRFWHGHNLIPFGHDWAVVPEAQAPLRLKPQGGWYDRKVPFSARPHGPKSPFSLVNSASPQIGPERSRARSGEANP